MARIRGRARNVQDVGAFSAPQGLEFAEIRLQRAEGSPEKKQRLRQEFLSFIVKDLLTYILAVLVILSVATYSVWSRWQPGLATEDR